MMLLFLLLARVVYSDDSPAIFKPFPKELCLAQSGKVCLFPKNCGQKELDVYKHPESRPICDLQIIIMQFDEKKTLMEIWAEGSSITVKNKADTKIGFEVKGGKVVQMAEMANNNLKVLDSSVDENKFYVKFNSDNFPEPSRLEENEKIIVKAKFTYEISRIELSATLKYRLKRWCKIPTVKSGLGIPAEYPDSYMTDIPVEQLFANEITCEQPSELFYEKNNMVKRASKIGCIDTGSSYLFEVSTEEISPYLVPENTELKIGCLHKNCLECKEPDLPCQGSECPKIQKGEGCPVYHCPRSFLQTQDGIVVSDITCAKTTEGTFAWVGNNKTLTSVKCAKEAPCHVASPFKCEDATCSMMTNITETPIHCKKNKQMYVEPIGGTKTAIEEITCNPEIGKYMKSNVSEVPKGAKVICQGTKGSALKDQPNTGEMTYFAAGGVGLLVLIVVLVLVIVCIRKSRKKRGNVSVETTTKQETAVSGATSKSSEARNKSAEKPALPETAPTQHATPTPATPTPATTTPAVATPATPAEDQPLAPQLAPSASTKEAKPLQGFRGLSKSKQEEWLQQNLSGDANHCVTFAPGGGSKPMERGDSKPEEPANETKIPEKEKKKEKKQKKEKKPKKSKKKRESEKESEKGSDEDSDEKSKTGKKKKKIESERDAMFGPIDYCSQPEEKVHRTQKTQNVTEQAAETPKVENEKMKETVVIPTKLETKNSKKQEADDQYEALGDVEARAQEFSNAADVADKLLKTQDTISGKETEKK